MFRSIGERVVVSVLAALLLAAVYWAWNQVTIAATALGVPKGLVAMSAQECSSLSGGWTQSSDVSGRFVIGTGSGTDINGVSKSFVVGDAAGRGGEYEVTLTKDHMPPHRHGVKTGYDFNPDNGLEGAQGDSTSPGIFQDFDRPNPEAKQDGGHGINPNVLEEVGGGQPHSNMPPFIALNFCVKS